MFKFRLILLFRLFRTGDNVHYTTLVRKPNLPEYKKPAPSDWVCVKTDEYGRLVN